MMNDARMLYLHALSRIHSGTGQSTDVIDLPIAREKVTGWPYMPASSIKGVLRDACDPGKSAAGESDEVKRDRAARRTRLHEAFGPDTSEAEKNAGALIFTDAQLLCLPVRSYYGVFAWLSCPLALRRWRRDAARGGRDGVPALADLPTDRADQFAILVPDGSNLVQNDAVFLEDYDLVATASASTAAIADYIAKAVFAGEEEWQQEFRGRFAVVSDNLFTMLTEVSTEVDARIRLDQDSKTVARGALWYEESTPAESIFVCPLLAAPRNGTAAAALFDLLSTPLQGLLQIGGNASIGRGLVEARLW